ncbi:MAG TPA: prephenate dehydrogenase [Actinomycetes bacterium]|nr:prephenate dehydrogenase [Actinomycetes bacterium]
MTVPTGQPPVASVLIAGTGLMGTSLGLALRARGVETYLSDRDPTVARAAAELGAGLDRLPPGPVTLAVIAVPPTSVAAVLADLQGKDLAACYTDLASTKAYIQDEVDRLAVDPAGFVGGHPMAGRERSGPGSARGDLFVGRPWVLTPTARTAPDVLGHATAMAELAGATPYVMTPAEHDHAMAVVSHAPHVLAALVAARLADAEPAALGLAGPGVRDVTRVAAGDPALWREILATNSAAVAAILDAVGADLAEVTAELRGQSGPAAGLPATVDALARGNRGVERIPGKHGTPPARYQAVPVVLDDRPGQLAALFGAAGAAGINIEDVRIEHSPGQPVGLIELDVRPEVADDLAGVLRERGWIVQR